MITIITYLSLVIGELVPKQLALRNAERLACMMAPAMEVLARIASPFVWLLDQSGRLILALFGRRDSGERNVTEEEIRVLVAEAESAGVIEPEEGRMISAVMRLGDRPVRAVMTPRPEVDMVDLSESPVAIRRTIIESVHSRIPAHDGNPDEIIGVIHAKDMLDGIPEAAQSRCPPLRAGGPGRPGYHGCTGSDRKAQKLRRPYGDWFMTNMAISKGWSRRQTFLKLSPGSSGPRKATRNPMPFSVTMVPGSCRVRCRSRK